MHHNQHGPLLTDATAVISLRVAAAASRARLRRRPCPVAVHQIIRVGREDYPCGIIGRQDPPGSVHPDARRKTA
jgi:hypothetical protein